MSDYEYWMSTRRERRLGKGERPKGSKTAQNLRLRTVCCHTRQQHQAGAQTGGQAREDGPGTGCRGDEQDCRRRVEYE